MKHALPLLCASLALAGACAQAQPAAPAPTLPPQGAVFDPADPAHQPSAVPALPGQPVSTPDAQAPAVAAPRAPLPGSEVLEEGDPRLDAVTAAPAPERKPRTMQALDGTRLARYRGFEDPKTHALLRAAYPLADVTYHRGWGLDATTMRTLLEPAPGRYSQLSRHCGLVDGKPLGLLELQARQARDGVLAARERRGTEPDVVGTMSASGRYAKALRITRVADAAPVLALLQKPSGSRLVVTGSSEPHELESMPLLSAHCPQGSLPDETLREVLQGLFPQGGAGTGALMLAQVALGELSSPGAMRVPGAAQAPVHAHVLAREGGVVLTAYVRGAGLGAPESFERVLELMQSRQAHPVSVQRTLLDGRGTGQARFVFDSYELVLGMHVDASGERLTLELRKP